MRYIAKLWSVIAVMALVGGCGGGADSDNSDGHRQQTTIRGRAPLNGGGKIRIFDRAGKPFENDIAADGSFEAKMGLAEGHFVIEASGGRYIEPANGKPADHAGQSLHAVVTHLNAFGEADVAVTPWTEIAYARGGVQGYADSLKALSDMLSCQGVIYGDVLVVPPALPVHGIHSLSNSPALGYIYLGAFSQLAHDLSQEIHLEQGRLGSMRLAKILAEDFSDGRIDGHKDGVVIYLVSGHALPADVLRQRLAQAARHFLQLNASEAKDWGNLSSIGEDAMLDLLSCISESTDVQLGPAGEPLDRHGPALAIVAPDAEGYVSSPQDVVCEAKDESGVASLDVSLVRQKVAQPEALGAAQLLGEETVRRLVAPLRIENVSTGELEVHCHATDRWGNSSTLVQSFHVNRGGIAPKISLTATDPNHLAGRVEITCDCEADPYSSQCALVAPDGEQGLQAIEQSARRVTYVWETGQVLDGPRVLTCGNTTRGLVRPLVESKRVHVKNHQDGLARGAVYLDTRVKGMQVDVYGYEDGKQGRRLGGGDVDSEGNFEFPLSTEYRGPVLVRAEYSRSPSQLAQFHNVPLGKAMSCSNALLTLLIEHYAPGQQLTGLSVNVASSMHEAFAVALWKLGRYSTFYQAATTAQILVANYLSGSGTTIDPRFTWVMDLSKKIDVADDAQMVMGLFHVGLSRLAIDYSLQYGRGSDQAITISEIIQAMRQDLSDGKLDGKAHGAQVYMPHNAPLTEDFFRIELARAIRRWLDEKPHAAGHHAAPNQSGLTMEAVTSQSPILQNFAKHYSTLFDNRVGEDYDGDGPRIAWRTYGSNQQPFELNGTTLGSTSFRLVVEAKDESGIAKLTVKHNGVEQVNQSSSVEPGHGEFVINTSTLTGPQRLVIEAQDVQGNPETVESIAFTVDRASPDITLESDVRWIRDGHSYHLVGTVAKPHVTAQVFLDDAPAGDAIHIDGTAFAVPVTMSCGTTHHVRVEARDDAGNTDNKQQVVHCDNRAPTIGHLPSPFTQERSKAVVELEHRMQPNSDAIELKGRDEAMVLEKQWDRFDDRGAHNPPTLRFTVGDVGGSSIGAPPDSLRVMYKYIFRGAGVTRERDWTPVTCTREGACKVVMSYQTMLPEDVLRQPVNVARRQNFIAYSNVDDLHSILVKAEDLAGNITVAEWSFRLQFYGPAVMVECGVHETLRKRTLEPPTLQEHAVAHASSFDVSLSWTSDMDVESLTPDGGEYVFSLPDSVVDWQVKKANFEMHLTKAFSPNNPYVPRQCYRKGEWSLEHWNSDWDNEEPLSKCEFSTDWRGTTKTWNEEYITDNNTYRWQQRLVPSRRMVNLHRNGIEQVSLLTLDVPTKKSGQPIRLEPAQNMTQFLSRPGWIYSDNDRSADFENHGYVKGIVLDHGAYRPTLQHSLSGTPQPIGITHSASCQNGMAVYWEGSTSGQAN